MFREHDNAEIFYKHEVQDFNRRKDGKWEVKVKDLNTKKVETYITDYVFIGAGGHAIPLLQKTGIPESKHLGVFNFNFPFAIFTTVEILNFMFIEDFSIIMFV